MRYGSNASRILMRIFDTGDLIIENLHQPGLAFRYGLEEAIEIRDSKERAIQKREIRRLEKRKLVKIDKVADKYEVRLSDQGLLEVLRQKIHQTDSLPEGQDCIVLFDIPETKRKLRDGLRRLLKETGFFFIQRSVWMSPFDAGEVLAQFFEFIGNESWVRVYTGVRH